MKIRLIAETNADYAKKIEKCLNELYFGVSRKGKVVTVDGYTEKYIDEIYCHVADSGLYQFEMKVDG